LHARVVLDVGCGTGALGLAYRRLNPRVRYLGIEANRAAAQRAVSRLDQVALGDAESGKLPFDLSEGVDCLIYGDVLEHMRDPWRVLREHAQLLKDDGTVIICVPNVEHWSFVSALLRGGWDYQDAGLFDRMHLRWFTRTAVQEAITRAGLIPVDIAPRVFNLEAVRSFVGTLAPALQVLGVDPRDYLSRAAPLQYVWRARKRPAEALTIVSTMLAPVGGVSQVRVVDPLRVLATRSDVRTLIWNKSELPDSAPAAPGVFIFHRPALCGDNGIAALRSLIAKNTLIVTEFDDDPAGIPILQRPDMWNFSGVHAVQTTTPALAQILRRQNPEVAVFPNAIRELPEVQNFADPESMTLFFGGLNREGDWPPYVEALNAVAAMAGARLKFSIVHDQGLFEAIESEHKTFTPITDYATYLNLLGKSEISFMPLRDTSFNHAKSDLKFIEAASCRVVSLASPVVYGEAVQDGRTGLLFHSADELRHRLMHVLANRDAARTIGDAARTWVSENRMMAYQTEQRIAWYRSLWARRAELNAALLERMPMLAQEEIAA
jgi:SAM-dependent methyltransferase